MALFTRKGKRTIRPYLASKPFAHLIEVRKARYTLAELEMIYAQASRELAKLDFGVNASFDESGNRVEITVSDRKWFEAELDRVEAQLPKGVELMIVESGSTARDKELLFFLRYTLALDKQVVVWSALRGLSTETIEHLPAGPPQPSGLFPP